MFEHDKQSHSADTSYDKYDTLSFQDKLAKLTQDTVDDFASDNQLNANQKTKLNNIFSHANEDETPLGDVKTSVNVAVREFFIL